MGDTGKFVSPAVRLAAETIIGLAAAARRFPAYRGGGTINSTTVWRWIVEGVRLRDGSRLKLEGFRCGGRYLTSEEALARFLDRQNPDREVADAPPPRTPGQRRRAAERAGETLTRMGI
jgi:Protein of unknown function (DUF1580)